MPEALRHLVRYADPQSFARGLILAETEGRDLQVSEQNGAFSGIFSSGTLQAFMEMGAIVYREAPRTPEACPPDSWPAHAAFKPIRCVIMSDDPAVVSAARAIAADEGEIVLENAERGMISAFLLPETVDKVAATGAHVAPELQFTHDA